MTLVGSDRVGTQEQRVIDAALRCIARWGVSKTTLDDVAREASCSRATIYRQFPGGKDALLGAIARTELARFFSGLARTFGAAPRSALQTRSRRRRRRGRRRVRPPPGQDVRPPRARLTREAVTKKEPATWQPTKS